MTRRWRRSGGLGQAASGPRIIDVNTDGSDVVTVLFSAAVTWDGVDQGTLTIDGDPCQWSAQLAPTQLQASSFFGNPHSAGEAWTLAGPEPGLVPAVLLPEAGVTS